MARARPWCAHGATATTAVEGTGEARLAGLGQLVHGVFHGEEKHTPAADSEERRRTGGAGERGPPKEVLRRGIDRVRDGIEGGG